jgi:hypothetical protein
MILVTVKYYIDSGEERTRKFLLWDYDRPLKISDHKFSTEKITAASQLEDLRRHADVVSAETCYPATISEILDEIQMAELGV